MPSEGSKTLSALAHRLVLLTRTKELFFHENGNADEEKTTHQHFSTPANKSNMRNQYDALKRELLGCVCVCFDKLPVTLDILSHHIFESL